MAQDQPPPPGQPPSPPPAQQTAVQPAQQPLGQGQLEELLAPIALYPDDLVAQILTASTYPIEVVQAQRWVADHPNLQGNALQDAMQQQSWDPSVKGLTAVPQVLSMMNDKLDWTQQLGEAFLAQPNDVSNAIQQLRVKASANGNLKSSNELTVGTIAASTPPPPPGPPPPGVDPAMLPPPPPSDYITIQPTDPGMYYVPVYDPALAYGPWPWPAYSPFYWYPPGYVLGAAVIGFGVDFLLGRRSGRTTTGLAAASPSMSPATINSIALISRLDAADTAIGSSTLPIAALWASRTQRFASNTVVRRPHGAHCKARRKVFARRPAPHH